MLDSILDWLNQPLTKGHTVGLVVGWYLADILWAVLS